MTRSGIGHVIAELLEVIRVSLQLGRRLYDSEAAFTWRELDCIHVVCGEDKARIAIYFVRVRILALANKVAAGDHILDDVILGKAVRSASLINHDENSAFAKLGEAPVKRGGWVGGLEEFGITDHVTDKVCKAFLAGALFSFQQQCCPNLHRGLLKHLGQPIEYVLLNFGVVAQS